MEDRDWSIWESVTVNHSEKEAVMNEPAQGGGAFEFSSRKNWISNGAEFLLLVPGVMGKELS